MAIAFPTMFSYPPGYIPPKPTHRYEVDTNSYDDMVVVRVSKDLHSPVWRKTISLKNKWWNRESPAERIRQAEDKAALIADKYNHDYELMQHEASIGVRCE